MLEILNQFLLSGRAISCEPYGNGHINRTYLVITDAGRRYILQRINDAIFRDVEGLMRNIALVTDYLRAHGQTGRNALSLVSTKDGARYLHSLDGGFYRVYEFIEDSVCLERAENEEDFRQSGVAFGEFQRQLADFPAHTLTETIPHFHDTRDRYRLFREALAADAFQRAQEVQPEIAFVLSREAMAGSMLSMLESGALPLRVTHNDTKLNNVMLDAATRKPLCVIDLDTVMPGLAGNDFGDSIRFGASTAPEDEQDLSRVEMSLSLYRAYADGFLSACGNSLQPAELETLPLGAMLMTLECGVRFLTDYLQGDTYFRIHRAKHNLDRCRTQFHLVADMERKQDAMLNIVMELARNAS